jgi:hypothetical protein
VRELALQQIPGGAAWRPTAQAPLAAAESPAGEHVIEVTLAADGDHTILVWEERGIDEAKHQVQIPSIRHRRDAYRA